MYPLFTASRLGGTSTFTSSIVVTIRTIPRQPGKLTIMREGVRFVLLGPTPTGSPVESKFTIDDPEDWVGMNIIQAMTS